jgi:hypothetical protein
MYIGFEQNYTHHYDTLQNATKYNDTQHDTLIGKSQQRAIRLSAVRFSVMALLKITV